MPFDFISIVARINQESTGLVQELQPGKKRIGEQQLLKLRGCSPHPQP